MKFIEDTGPLTLKQVSLFRSVEWHTEMNLSSTDIGG